MFSLLKFNFFDVFLSEWSENRSNIQSAKACFYEFVLSCWNYDVSHDIKVGYRENNFERKWDFGFKLWPTSFYFESLKLRAFHSMKLKFCSRLIKYIRSYMCLKKC